MGFLPEPLWRTIQLEMVRAFITFFVALGGALAGAAMGIIGNVIRGWPISLSWVFGVGSRLTLWAAGVRLEIEGIDHVLGDRAQILVGNHQSALDIPVLAVPLRGHIRFMAKESIFRIPIIGRGMLGCDFIPVDRSNPRAVMAHLGRMMEALQTRSITYVIFPEGTRSLDGRLLPFRRGVMKICQRAGVDVVPFSIDGTIAVHRRGARSIKPGTVRLTFGTPISATRVKAMSGTELMQEVRTAVASGLPQESVSTTKTVTEGT